MVFVHLFKYDESSYKPLFRPRHPLLCLKDSIGFILTLFLLSFAQSWSVFTYLIAVALLYGASFFHHWIKDSLLGRTLDHVMIFVLLSSTALPLWGEHWWGWVITGVIIIIGAGYKIHTFNVGKNTFTRGSSAIIYILATVPQLTFFFRDWYSSGLWSEFHWFWAIGSILFLVQLGIYTLKWPNWKPKLYGYREVQHDILLLASSTHSLTYLFL